jgi:hypothetical protein
VRGVTVTVPEEVDEALRAEEYRTGGRRHEILADWFRATWPDYVAGRLRRDLRSPIAARVVAPPAPQLEATRRDGTM